MSERRAIVFDLDDTLYPQERFMLSGFLTVSRLVETRFGVPRATVMRILKSARRSHPGREFQALCRRCALSETIVPELITAVRTHRPWIRLPALSAIVLRALRPLWRIGVLTNGMPSVQRRKVDALELMRLVDVVLYAEEHVPGGKPSPATFHAVRERLEVSAQRTVFVGDDPVADIFGANRAGFRTIYVSRSRHAWSSALPAPDARLASIVGVPRAAERILAGRGLHHVA